MPSRLRIRERFGDLRRRGNSVDHGNQHGAGLTQFPSATSSLNSTPSSQQSHFSQGALGASIARSSTAIPKPTRSPSPPQIIIHSSNESAVTIRRNSSSTVHTSAGTSINVQHIQNIYTPQSIWNEALSKISIKDRTMLLDNCIINPCDSATLIQEVEMKRREVEKKRWVNTQYTWNGRTYKIFKLMENVINWVDRFKSIGDIVSQYDPTHAALPWAAVRMLLQVVVEDKANMTAIALVLERLTNVVAICSIYIEMYLCQRLNFTELLKNAIVQLYMEMLSFLAFAMEYFSSTFRVVKSLLEAGAFVESLTEIDKLMGRVRDIVQLAQSTVQNSIRDEQKEAFTRLQQQLKGLGGSVEGIGLTTQELHQDMEDKNRDAFRAWLSPCKHESHHLDAGEGILENTGEWLFNMNPKFQEWRDSPTSAVLWLKGNPGVGKTRLTHAAVAKAHNEASNNEEVVYFYCSRGDDARRRPEIILGTLLKEIIINPVNTTPPDLRERYQERNEKGPLRIQELQKWICQCLAGRSQTTIFIDAVDEIYPDKRREFLDILRNIVSDNEMNVKLWISSREEADVRYAFPNSQEVAIHRQHESEIRTYVEREITKHVERGTLLDGKVEEEFKRRIVDTISEKSEGMFLWAHLQIGSLQRLHRRKHVEERLNKLPTDLTATYDEIFAEVLAVDHSDDREAAKMALRWVMCAIKPLTPDEWAHAAWLSSSFIQALSGTGGMIEGLPDRDLTPVVLHKLCHNFVSVDNQLNEVRFTHQSVRDYLEDRADFMREMPDYIAARTCLAYLSYSKSIIGPFSQYVIDNWSVHCKRVTQNPHRAQSSFSQTLFKAVIREARDFLRPCNVYHRWLSHVNDIEFCHNIDPLFVAARYGLAEICKEMLTCKDQDASPRNLEDRTPLHAAAQFGHTDVVELYLDVDKVDVNEMDKDGRTPLAWAVFSGHQPVVKLLLLSPKVKVNIPDGLGKFAPLTRAAWRGNEQMVKLVMDQGKDVEVDKRDSFGMTALMWASRRGDKPVMSALIQGGADVNAADRYRRTSLHWALISREVDAFAQLTKHPGIDPNCRDVNGMTPLYYACKYRKDKTLERTLKKLLEVRGVDVNSSCYYATPLIVLADTGQCAAVRILAKAPGVDVNAVALKNRTALIIATLNNDADCVSALLETARDLDVHVRDATGKTALMHAVERGFSDIIMILLSKEGVEVDKIFLEDISGKDISHEEILSVARNEPLTSPRPPPPPSQPRTISRPSSSSSSIASSSSTTSLNHPPTIDPLYIFSLARRACKNKNDLSSRTRLAALPNINIADRCGDTALHIAARYNRLSLSRSIVSALLELGIQPDAKNLWGKTPLIEASRLGNLPVVELLLSTTGVNPNAQDIRGRTALFLSIRHKPELEAIIKRLLRDPRVIVNATDNNNVTPISQAVHTKAINIAEMLLATGKADVNLTDHLGFTALTYAAMKGPVEILRMLLDVEGVDVECRDMRWYTPLALAAKYGYKDAVGELLRKKASLVARTNKGLTPLELAEEYEHAEIVELLNNAG